MRRRFTEILQESFQQAYNQKLSLIVVVTFVEAEPKIHVFSEDYGFKLEKEKELKGLNPSVEVVEATAKALHEKYNVKAKYHEASDTDIAVDRERILMLSNL